MQILDREIRIMRAEITAEREAEKAERHADRDADRARLYLQQQTSFLMQAMSRLLTMPCFICGDEMGFFTLYLKGLFSPVILLLLCGTFGFSEMMLRRCAVLGVLILKIWLKRSNVK